MTAPRTSTAAAVRGIGTTQVVACLGAIMIFTGWAFWPLGFAEARREPAKTDSVEPSREWNPPELQIAAFSAPLWVAPPAPPPPPAPQPKAPPPPPLKIQLLAVVNQDGVYEAILFDPDADKIYTLREGESLGARTVERVSATGVDLRDVAGVRTLALHDAEGKR